jgi:NADPH-dependent glutamate synthase beta subunit-like oxidoreductase
MAKGQERSNKEAKKPKKDKKVVVVSGGLIPSRALVTPKK